MATTYIEAAQRLVDYPALEGRRYRDRSAGKESEEVHTSVVEFYTRFRRELARRGYPFVATEFYRSETRQDELFRKGVTKARGGQSPHNHGCAVDVIHFLKGWDLTHKEWGIVGAIGMEVARKMRLKVVWGGDWKFFDPAHWELEKWRAIRDVVALKPYDQFTDEDMFAFIATMSLDKMRETRVNKSKRHAYWAWVDKVVSVSSRQKALSESL